LGYSIFAGTGSGAWIFLHLQHCVVGIEKRPNKSKCSSYIYIYKDTDTDTDTETDTDTDTDRSASLASGCRHRCSTRKPECKPNQTKSRSKAPENSEIPRGGTQMDTQMSHGPTPRECRIRDLPRTLTYMVHIWYICNAIPICRISCPGSMLLSYFPRQLL